jgi:hypothetical protein
MAESTTPEITIFGPDMTLRWPCRRGDFLLWLRYGNLFSGPAAIECHDLWEMRDGYHVTITNRLEDLPLWFKLHPTEVCNSFVYKLMPKIEKGDYPSEPVDSPNLWRMKSGDRLAWVGADRPERRSVNGVLAILDCDSCGLVVGEGERGSIEEFIGLGRPTTPSMKPENVARCKAALKMVKQMGFPRTWDRTGGWVIDAVSRSATAAGQAGGNANPLALGSLVLCERVSFSENFHNLRV